MICIEGYKVGKRIVFALISIVYAIIELIKFEKLSNGPYLQ
jgi:hypothetical protein